MNDQEKIAHIKARRAKSSARYRSTHLKELTERMRKHRAKNKLAAFDAYGGRICSWCKEDDISTLIIDHVNNNGSQHRAQLSVGKNHTCGSATIYRWLKRNNYPLGFQVLCANCNLAKALNNGILPLNRKDKYLNLSKMV